MGPTLLSHRSRVRLAPVRGRPCEQHLSGPHRRPPHVFPRSLAMATILIATTAAGCLGGQDDSTSGENAVADDAGAGNPTVFAGANMTDAAASENASMAAGHMPHMHDYWNGRSRVTVLDTDIEISSDDVIVETVLAAFLEQEYGRVGGVSFTLPDGQVVYEGAGRMEITASWTDPSITGLAFAYEAGGMREWSASLPLGNAETFELEVSPDMTDLPHMTKSRWNFLFHPDTTPGVAAGTFHLTIDIVKLRDISAFPGHPELFNGKPEKVLLDANGRSSQVSYVKRIPNLALTGEFGENWITPTELVPLETKAIRVDVNVTKAEASAGQVSEIRLYYLTAASSNAIRAEEIAGSFDSGWIAYALPVSGDDVDSPYAPESQWRILVEAATTVTGAERTCGGCVDTDIEFHVRVTAYDHDMPEPAE